jgi:hypothetical protein
MEDEMRFCIDGSVAVLILGLAGFGCSKMSSDDLELWTTRINTAEAAFSQTGEAWRTAAREFMANPVLGTGACEAPTPGGGPENMHLTEASALDNVHSKLHEVQEMALEVGTAYRLLTGDHPMLPIPSMEQAIERAATPENWGHDWLLLASAVVAAEMIDGSTYQPGYTTGWLLIWSYAESRFVCAGPYRAESSEQVVRTGAGDSAAIRWDLTSQAFEAGELTLAALPATPYRRPRGPMVAGNQRPISLPG